MAKHHHCFCFFVFWDSLGEHLDVWCVVCQALQVVFCVVFLLCENGDMGEHSILVPERLELNSCRNDAIILLRSEVLHLLCIVMKGNATNSLICYATTFAILFFSVIDHDT